jgi:hypothetical protein
MTLLHPWKNVGSIEAICLYLAVVRPYQDVNARGEAPASCRLAGCQMAAHIQHLSQKISSIAEFQFSDSDHDSRVHRYGESVLIWNPDGFQELAG